MGKHDICWVPFSALLSLLRQREYCRATMNSKNSQSSQPKSICFRDIVEVNVHGIVILWGHMEEILSGISNLNSCSFWWIIGFIVFPLCIDCWEIGSQNLRPPIASIQNLIPDTSYFSCFQPKYSQLFISYLTKIHICAQSTWYLFWMSRLIFNGWSCDRKVNRNIGS